MKVELRWYVSICMMLLFLNFANAQTSAQEIIDRSIEVSGGNRYENYHMEFDFRDKHYVSKRNNGVFEYTRVELKDGSQIITSYGNLKPFQLEVDGKVITINEKKAASIQNSINSVNYFVLLPFGLNDEAVFKTYKGEKNINGVLYHEIEVTFSENGGGKDFEDVYYYWIHPETFKVDFLAYSFLVDGGGIRFREAYNERYVNGIRFVDYSNYKPKTNSIELAELPELFESQELELVSKIEIKNIQVRKN